jgi:tetratricopeptide (TPR) repeat protein
MTMPPTRSARQRALWITAAAGLAACTLGGCATAPPPAEKPAAAGERQPSHIALLPLARAAAREARRPVREAALLPPPPGVDPSLHTPIEDDGRALLPLAEVVAQFAERDLPVEAFRDAEPAGDREREAALRRYLSGRQKLLEGDAAGALEDLRHAARLDPLAPEPWRELGDVHVMRSSRTEAVAAYRAAIARGLGDPRLFELLGRDALDRDEYDVAALFFARGLLASAGSEDPLLPTVIEVGLAGALASEGYIIAARDALKQALERQTPGTTSTRYIQEYGAIFRRQGDLWREVGDAEIRLGRFTEALAAYQRAAELPAINDAAILSRIVYAAMRAGRPATAATAVVHEIIDAGGLVSENDTELLRHIAGQSAQPGAAWNSPVRLETAAALATYRTALGDDLAPSIARDMVRAEAAVLGSAAARALLRDHLTRSGPDVMLASDLVNLCTSADDAVREAASVVAAAPLAADEFAEALLRSRFATEDLEAFLSSTRSSPAQRFLAAHVQARVGRYSAAADLLDTVPADAALGPALSLARAEFTLAAGRAAAPPIDLPVPGDPGAAHTTARTLLLFQRHDQALALLEPILKEQSGGTRRQRFEALLLAAELGAQAGRTEDAEKWLRQALILDTHDDRPYAQLLSLYAPGAPAADNTRSSQTLRDLRTNIPESRTERLLITRELLRRTLLPQAEVSALDLADESLDLAALELLTGVWQAQAQRGDEEAIDRGLAWIESNRLRRPCAVPLLAAATTLLVSADRTEESATLLKEAIEAGAGRDVARILERVLRDGLGRRGEADELALARLEGRSLSPADSIDLAELCTRLGRHGDAAAALREALDPDITLIADQPDRLIALLGQMTENIQIPAAGQAPMPATAAPSDLALDLLARVIARGIELPSELHERRLRLLAASPDATIEDIRAAANHATDQHPALRWRPWAVAAHVAGATGRGDLGLQLIEEAVANTNRPEVELLLEWFVFVVMAGDAETARGMIDKLHADGRLGEVLGRINIELQPDADPRAEAAFVLGNEYANLGREDDAAAAYELAIEYAPAHAWACNNLGYMILENGGDLARADELLTRAFESMPGETAIIDSLGWLRYMQGRFEDQRDEETGRIVKRGAVTLLARAARSASGRENPTILDHYGDALYRVGRAEQARSAWRAAHARATERVSQHHLAQRRQAGGVESPVIARGLEQYKQIADSAARKLRAAAEDEPVPVAPIAASAAPADQPGDVAPGVGAAAQPPPGADAPEEPTDTPEDQHP